MDDLRKRASARPSHGEDLVEHNQRLVSEKIVGQEVLSLIERLRTDGVIVVTGTKVSYALPNKVA